MSPTKEQMQELASECALLHEQLGRLGLYRTMHKMHEVVREVGDEIASQLAKEWVDTRDKRLAVDATLPEDVVRLVNPDGSGVELNFTTGESRPLPPVRLCRPTPPSGSPNE